MDNSLRAVCTHCEGTLELVREGTQTATISHLVAFLDAHRDCRQNGDVLLLEGEADG